MSSTTPKKIVKLKRGGNITEKKVLDLAVAPMPNILTQENDDVQSRAYESPDKSTSKSHDRAPPVAVDAVRQASMAEADNFMRLSVINKRSKTISSSKNVIDSAIARYVAQGGTTYIQSKHDLKHEPSMTEEMHALLYAMPLFTWPNSGIATLLALFCIISFLLSAWQPTAYILLLSIAYSCTPTIYPPYHKWAAAFGTTLLFVDGVIVTRLYSIQLICIASLLFILWRVFEYRAVITQGNLVEYATSAATLVLLLIDLHFSILPLVFVTVIVYLSIFAALTVVCWMERIRSFVLHPSIALDSQKSSIHWFLICLRLGMPGLEKTHSNVSRHLCALDDSMEPSEAFSKAILKWLKEDYPTLLSHFGDETLLDIAKYIGTKNEIWIAKGAPPHVLRVYYAMTMRLYIYDRYIRPYVIRPMVYLYGSSAVNHASSGWRPSIGIQNCTVPALWSNSAVCKNPRYISKRPKFGDMIDYAANDGIGIIGQLLYKSHIAVKHTFHDLAYNSPGATVVLQMLDKWISSDNGAASLDSDHLNNDANEDGDDKDADNQNDAKSGLKSIISLVSQLKFYLSESEIESLRTQIFGSHNGITRCPRTDASMFYGSQYLKSEF